MAKARFIYNNLWRDGIMLAPSSENPQHPATDTQIDTLSMFCRASSKTSPFTIPLNQGATPDAIDFVAILAHNIESSGVVITLEGADNSAFDSGFVSRTITYNATNIFEFVTIFTKQYVRLKLVKAGGDFTDYPQVATIICGKYFEPNCNFDWKYTEGDIDSSRIEYSDSMVIFAQEKDEIFRGEYLFASLDDTAVISVQELITLCGIHKAFIVCFDYNNANTESRWVRLLSVSQPKAVFHNIWGWSCPIEEIK